jgi:CheY-like chemotaxis protein/HPt (histidine-containing phosphotransfer) domain-containing protein
VLGQKQEQSPALVTRHSIAEQKKLDLRILLAEDNPINQKLAIVLLQKAGYSVDAVENGLDALEKVQANQYSVVLMDVQMPELDGLEATQRIRELERSTGRHIPIIAMTAHAMQGDRERCLDAGMDDYVTKPLEPKVLFNALERWAHAALHPVGQSSDGEETLTEEVQDYSSPADVFATGMDDGLFGEDAPSDSHESEMPALAFQAGSYADLLPVNFEAALHRFDNDRTFMMEMFKEYKEHLPARLTEIQAALQAGDAGHLARVAHNLKGISLNFSAEPVADIALKLEEKGKREDLTYVPDLVAQLEAEVHRLEAYLSTKGL